MFVSLSLFELLQCVDHLFSGRSLFIRRKSRNVLVQQLEHRLLFTSLLSQVIKVLAFDSLEVVSIVCKIYLEVVMDTIQI